MAVEPPLAVPSRQQREDPAAEKGNPSQPPRFLWAKSRAVYAVAIFLIIAISFWTGTARQYLNFDNPSTDVAREKATDVDYHMLYPSIEAKKSFVDTFKYWREPWRADQWVGAYWRPMTMQAWWVQAHVFGEDKTSNWMRVSLVLSVLFDLLLVVFVRTLTKNKWIALATLAIFALPPWWLHFFSALTVLPRVANVDLMITQGWKDQPDLWANCFVLGAMIFAAQTRYAWALACTALAICFKESGLMAFPIMLVIVGGTGGLKRIPIWVYGVSVAMLCLMMYARWLAGPLVFHFHSYGSDASGLTRYSIAMLPLGLEAFSSFGQALCGLGLFGMILWRPKSLITWLLCLLAILGASVGLVSWQEGLPLDVGFAQFILLGAVPVALLVAWLLLVFVLWKQKAYLAYALILAACGYIAALPFAMATQAAEHCLALGRALQAGYGACVVFALYFLLLDLVQKRNTQRPFEAAVG